ncbi:MAG: lipid-A-disaccharide synthase, partial [Chitinophagaceae bacterium]
VVFNLRTIIKNLAFCKKDILNFKPDVIVLIDYPGFNIRIAKWAHHQGIKVVYYISPQVWAWKENRVKTLKASVDRMLVILPFEKEFYRSWNWEVDYVGHPLVEVVESFKKEHPGILRDEMLVAILPGSRKQEILKKLPVMLEATKHFPGYQFVVAKAPGLSAAFYNEMLKAWPNVRWVENKTYHLLAEARAALVTSGTATLETALFDVPQVICYKGSNVSYQIAKRLVKIRFIGLVNLIMNKEVVKELIQNEMNVENIVSELKPLLTETDKRKYILDEYDALRKLLVEGGDASANAAKEIIDLLSIK